MYTLKNELSVYAHILDSLATNVNPFRPGFVIYQTNYSKIVNHCSRE